MPRKKTLSRQPLVLPLGTLNRLRWISYKNAIPIIGPVATQRPKLNFPIHFGGWIGWLWFGWLVQLRVGCGL
jgi:hypothetical protein